jgi:hypothetical protein
MKTVTFRVGVSTFFAMKLKSAHWHLEGAHRALSFSDFVGLLVEMGMEEYCKGNALPEARQEEAPDEEFDEVSYIRRGKRHCRISQSNKPIIYEGMA